MFTGGGDKHQRKQGQGVKRRKGLRDGQISWIYFGEKREREIDACVH